MKTSFSRADQSMNSPRTTGIRILFAIMFAIQLSLAFPCRAQAPASGGTTQKMIILELQGVVELMPKGASTWVLTQTNQLLHPGDRVRTGADSRVTIRWSDQSIVPFGALTEIEIQPPPSPGSLPGLHLIKGMASFLHRDEPGRIKVITRGANASVEGTEFVMEVSDVDGVESTSFFLIDGKVILSNALGALVLTNNQSAIAEVGKSPVRTAGFIANNVLQWCFYYPAVVDLADLSFDDSERQGLGESIMAYQSGDLLRALAVYHASRPVPSDSERVYHAAILLSVGQVKESQALLETFNRADKSENLRRVAESLNTLVSAVKRQPKSSLFVPRLATEFLAESYYQQSRATGEESLRAAVDCARQAVKLSPESGFARARLAELQFGFGHTREASQLLDRSLQSSPRNAQALALRGFILAAQNQTARALDSFNSSLAVDAALGNAWLGRGLCRIRQGEASGGREDLMTAAALEPQRSLLRSYLGKAYSNAGDDKRAGRELQLAIRMDPGDPTGWLYQALLKQQQNRVNQSLNDLGKSQSLNDNRGLFRSRLLLDQDSAVRSANLASLYRDDGMTDVSVREAARAVAYDYDNYTAHLFLAESYDALRDPTRFNVRYDTVWFNELLLANLLSPVGAGRLSQNVTEQEYSRLLDSDGFGAANSTTARSDKSLNELASQFGTFGRTSYSFDLDYRHNEGVRPNNDLNSIEWYTTLKQQVGPDDTALVFIKYEDYRSGDNFQYYEPTNARPSYRYEENESPIVVAGWHHDWAPGVHTLLLAGRLVNAAKVSDTNASLRLGFGDPPADSEPFGYNYRNKLEVYTAELSQIFQWDRATILTGVRYQAGRFKTQTTLTNPPDFVDAGLFVNPSDTSEVTSHFRRTTGYVYVTVEPIERLWLTGGVVSDDISYPTDFRDVPIAGGQSRTSQVGPKAALVWEPIKELIFRGVFARSLGGVALDEDYRLEPTQLAGFPQSFRSLIPESLFSSVSAPDTEIYGGAMDLKLGSGTFAGVQVEQLNNRLDRQVGVFNLDQVSTFTFQPGTTLQSLDYRETAISASVNQLLGEGFAMGAGYKLDFVKMTDIANDLDGEQNYSATLHQASAYLLYNHPSGFFATADASWYHQHNSTNSVQIGAGPGDDFFHEDIYIGWRLLHRRLEARFGVLNLSDRDYHLSPLNSYLELPRKRTYEVRLSFLF